MSDRPLPIEHTARMALLELMRTTFADDDVVVLLDAPGADAGGQSVWVGPVVTDAQPHGLRGNEGPSYRGVPRVSVHVDVEDTHASVEQVTAEVWGLVGAVRDAVRTHSQQRPRPWPEGVHHAAVVRTQSSGVFPAPQAGYGEQVVVDVEFTGTF